MVNVFRAVQDFEEACYLLVKTGAVQVLHDDLLGTDRGRDTLSFLVAVLEPFIQGYQVHTHTHP